MSSAPESQVDDPQIIRLVRTLDSLTEGNLAADSLVAYGERAIAPLETFLLHGAARTVALPPCRAARALGALGASKTLLAYFQQGVLSSDPVVLFAEDAVRSTVARELLRWPTEEVFQTLWSAATQRVTSGMIEALGEFQRQQTIPLLFKTLEDDPCRDAAMDALCKTPKQTVDYAILSLRGKTEVSLSGASASRRRRAAATLLRSLGISRAEWQEMRQTLLDDGDAGTVVPTVAAGFPVAAPEDVPRMIQALFRVADKLNCLQEDEVLHLLETHRVEANRATSQIVSKVNPRSLHQKWLSPTWRILWHLGWLNKEDGQTEHPAC